MIVNGVWQEFLNIVRQEVGSRVVETWLKAVSIYEWDDSKKIVYIQSPNKFIKDWISKNYAKIFHDNLKRLFNVDEIEVRFLDIYSDESKDIKSKPPLPTSLIMPKSRSKVNILPARRVSGQLNDYYTFENFIVGPNNSMAFAAAQAVSERPGDVYNPLFIYGGSGLGKTHLLNAIGNKVKSEFKDFWVLYQPADTFVTEFITAIRFDKIHLFQEKYKEINVLLIDDIQFMANKDQTQETFFHIFNFLYESGKQLVFSSDVYPSDLQGMAQRLKSRFESGLIVDVKRPSFETRVAILKRKAEAQKVQVCEDVLTYIASKYVSSIRELEGALVRVIAYASLSGSQLTLELAKEVLFQASTSETPENIEVEALVEKIARKFGCSLSDLKSHKKTKELVLARQVVMFFMKKITQKSFRDIGMFLGKKDHTTVVHGYQKIVQMIDSDIEFSKKMNSIEEEIMSNL